jgi:NADH dehydrogenase
MNTNPNQTKQTLPHVVIVGAGFGGLRAARALAHSPVRVTLLDRNNYHLFQPLLYQVATAGLAPDEIAQPVRAILRGQPNLEFRIAEVRGANLLESTLDTDRGPIHYDFLILAAGGATHTFGAQIQARGSFGLKTLEDADAIREHLLAMCELALDQPDPEKRAALLTFGVAGGGPSGVESAGAIAELIRHLLPRDYPALNPAEASVVLLEASNRLLPALPERLARFSADALRRKGVEVRFGAAVERFDGQMIFLKDGSQLPARSLIWAAGVKAAPLFDALALDKGNLGRVVVQPSLQTPGHPEIFVIGDAAFLPGADGRPLPMVAPVAIQQAETAVRNILRLLQRQEPQPFVYHDPGVMATIGRGQAVAKLGPFQMSGLLAWLAWVVVHIFQLVGFRNRLQVMVDWIWNYFAYDRPVRRLARGPWRKEQPSSGD